MFFDILFYIEEIFTMSLKFIFMFTYLSVTAVVKSAQADVGNC